MPAGPVCRSTSGLALSLLLALSAPAVFAQADPACQTYVDAQWQPAKAGSMSACLLQLDTATTVYDAQGFKFGLWGTTLLSADVRYFYSSMDSGATWQVVGEKASIKPAGDSVMAAQANPPPAAAIQRSGVFGRITDFFTTDDDRKAMAQAESTPPQPVTTDMPAPVNAAGSRTQQIPLRSAPVTAGAVSQAPADGARHSCNMRLGARWEVVDNQSLQQCISLFDRSTDQFDTNGYKYGYWGGIYLAANRSEVLQSSNSRDWVTVLNR